MEARDLTHSGSQAGKTAQLTGLRHSSAQVGVLYPVMLFGRRWRLYGRFPESAEASAMTASNCLFLRHAISPLESGACPVGLSSPRSGFPVAQVFGEGCVQMPGENRATVPGEPRTRFWRANTVPGFGGMASSIYSRRTALRTVNSGCLQTSGIDWL